MTWSLLSVVMLVLLHSADVAAGAYPPGPNRFLGSCLDSTSGSRILDTKCGPKRFSAGTAYTDECMINEQLFHGANQPSDGSSRGEVNGTLILDMGDWDTSVLASMVAAIIAEEAVSCVLVKRVELSGS
ncbi:hypothetical protein PF008_g25169 [Phytophthora fragariae]|uniref:Kazal-like domain-containing protein n=1 Tax=Phytophthora fragariae TaxID=53985 RepID=A0A6G0QLJ3_9STRA|nr:hypothetical protein PF008_g25169 [Phytophthora fragariae]